MWYLATLGEEGEPWEGKAHAVERLVLAGRRPKTEDLEIEAPRFVRLLERCWHAEPAARPDAAEAAQELEAMAFDFDESDEHATRTQGSTQRLLADAPCQLPADVVQALEGQWRKEKLLRVHSVELAAGAGAAPAAAPSAAQQRLVDEAVRAVEDSCAANRGFRANGLALQRVDGLVSNQQLRTFCTHAVKLAQRDWTRPPFNATWHERRFKRYGENDWVQQTAETAAWRQAVAGHFRAYPQLPLPPSMEHPERVRVHTVFHACRREAAMEICKGGFAKLASLDEGYYGLGLYFSFDLKYVVEQYGLGGGDPDKSMADEDGNVTVIVCNVVVGNLYPVVEHPAPAQSAAGSLKGKAQVPKYDAHGVVVEGGPCTPCAHARWGAAGVRTYSELVLFEDAAVLPRFVLSVRRE
jgi:hypothetical protein